MKTYLKDMFPSSSPEEDWCIPLENAQQTHVVQTLIIQKINRKKRLAESVIQKSKFKFDPVSGEDKEIKEEKRPTITLIVKRDNRRKHNSHEWFLGAGGFAECYKNQYLFATDCATLYHPQCIVNLLRYIDSHPDVSVVTGRQRVMSKLQQKTKESFISLATMFRAAQCFDYEGMFDFILYLISLASFAAFNGAFALVGFLPVIPVFFL
jgi:cellulose synthase/poly-beta-1,6-N-acetylglucosamine synthase-like glycosyltransferase